MSNRLIAPFQKPNSSYYWFRIVVPERYRQALGRREVVASLKTRDLGEARRLCAARQQEWLDRFRQIEAATAANASADAMAVIDSYLASETRRLGSRGRVIAHELKGLAIAESCAFVDDDPFSDGEFERGVVDQASDVYAGLDRKTVELRRDALRCDHAGAVFVGIEAARRIEAAGLWGMAEGFLVEAFAHAGAPCPTDPATVAIAARHFIHLLLDHAQPDLEAYRAAFPAIQMATPLPRQIAPVAVQPATPTTAVEINTELREAIFGEAVKARTISEVFQAWTNTRPREQAKLVDEWRKATNRFVALWGDVEVAAITDEMVEGFRNALQSLPTRPAKDIASLPILDQIRIAREKDLPRLSGPTVAKSVSGIRVVLEYARDKLKLIKTNPAKLVTVEDAKSEVNARKCFDEDELATIFSSSMMIDPDSDRSDDEFWCVMLAPLTGLRPEEMATVRPSNVKQERGIWYISVELDPRKVRRKKNADGEANKTAKTKTSLRDVPIHWLLIEAGFLDFVEHQRQSGADWLLDSLEGDRYGKRANYLSRRLNRYIRGLGITDEEKVFYSMRHSMKRACRNSKMKEEIADLLAGHAPLSIGRKYGAGAAIDVLHEAVDLIEYPSIAWDPAIACARRRLAIRIGT
ncbi:MAG: site-specific integrase [Sphingomonas sp.]|jgi:integrase|uniref:site-specific integrase n=1 Tax=Sphingomonas sp. TaxID=28214 RepID=UPI001ACBC035|nr:site-specific integrase [Sphingomonas sp.]MBN8814129.1 site-specific integrase [Sphingomonas sp.]